MIKALKKTNFGSSTQISVLAGHYCRYIHSSSIFAVFYLSFT